jgi:pimeloyl-ACP methyl ester carboxylesterase
MITALLSACSSASDIYRGETSVAGKDVVVFLHGYYGSALREKNGGPRRFIRVSTIIGGNFAIALESQRLGLRPSPELEVEGLMAKVSILPFFYNNDVYGAFLTKLAKERTVVAFAYDWRKDLATSAGELDSLVKDLDSKGARSISLLAHSMGGLVASYYLMYGAQDLEKAKLDWFGAQRIKRVGFLGVPFGGAMAIFRNMQHGTGYPWNETLLESGTVSSWPASYHLVPLPNPEMLDLAGQRISVPLEKASFWRENQLGLLRKPSIPVVDAHRQSYTDIHVLRANRFHQLLRQPERAPKTLRVLNVRGRGRATLAKGYFDGKEFVFLPKDSKQRGLSFSALEEDGDGSVPLKATTLPASFTGKELLTDFAHDRLFDDPAVEKECLDFFTREN